MVVQKEFLDRAHSIVWCTVATVGPGNRPRSRVLHPIWEIVDGELTGWIVTRATPVKVRHLAYSNYVSCSYWEPGHDVAIADCRADWIDDAVTRQRIWELYREAPAPLGYDFWSVFPDGPAGESPSLLRLAPYRLRLFDVETLSGRRRPPAWP